MKQRLFISESVDLFLFGIIVAFLWGSPLPIIKYSYQKLGIQQAEIWEQVLFAGYRFFFASLFLLVLFWIIKKKTVIQKRAWKSIFVIGIHQTFLQYFFLYIGLAYSSGMIASLITGMGPFFQIIMAHFLLKDDAMTKRKVLAIFLGLIGICILYNPLQSNHFHIGWGEVLVLIGTIAGCYGNILSKTETKRTDVLFLTGFQMLIGSIGLIGFGVVQIGVYIFFFDWITFGLFAYLIFVSAVAFLLFNLLLKYYQASKVSIFLCLTPAFGVVFSWLLLNESLQLSILFSLIFIVLGIYLVNRPPKKKFT